jgi:hypothetical protein
MLEHAMMPRSRVSIDVLTTCVLRVKAKDMFGFTIHSKQQRLNSDLTHMLTRPDVRANNMHGQLELHRRFIKLNKRLAHQRSP